MRAARTVESCTAKMTRGSAPADRLQTRPVSQPVPSLNEPISRPVNDSTARPEHPATSHPWGRSLRKRDPRSWSRHQRIEAPPVDEEKPRDVTAAQRADAPFLAGLSGANPDRVERMRAGYWPEWAR